MILFCISILDFDCIRSVQEIYLSGSYDLD
jgi:hypothetical protein